MRIVLLGPPGSGKTTLAKKLEAEQGLVRVSGDEFFWENGKSVPLSEVEVELRRLLCGPHWVLEGQVGKVLPLVEGRVDGVVRLATPAWVSLSRMARREVLGMVLGPHRGMHWQKLRFNLGAWGEFEGRQDSVVQRLWEEHGARLMDEADW